MRIPVGPSHTKQWQTAVFKLRQSVMNQLILDTMTRVKKLSPQIWSCNAVFCAVTKPWLSKCDCQESPNPSTHWPIWLFCFCLSLVWLCHLVSACCKCKSGCLLVTQLSWWETPVLLHVAFEGEREGHTQRIHKKRQHLKRNLYVQAKHVDSLSPPPPLPPKKG